MKRGEVWWAAFPTKKRPVMILTRDAAIPFLSSLAVVPATRTIRGIPTEIPIGRQDGMREECVLAIDGLTTIDKSALDERITQLAPSRIEEVCDVVAYAFGCA